MSDTDPRRRRGLPLLGRLAAFCLVLCVFAALLVGVFELGVLAGAAGAAGLLVVYAVPATLFDWPRFGLSDLLDLVAAIGRGIAWLVALLFDW
jgi:hypothetical protein